MGGGGTDGLTGTDLHGTLRRFWGYDAFRPLQERIVRSLLAGRDVAVVMPTGGGKSLCYQLPAVVLGGTAVVVSPLIALMQDQAAQLAAMGIPAAVLSSAQSWSEQTESMRAARAGACRLLYLSPERLARPDTAPWLRNVPLVYFAIDEAHCISEWGHEFRPEYRLLGALRDHFPHLPIAAFTASATRRVRQDILAQLRLQDPHKYIASFHRPNLRYLVRECDSDDQERLLIAALRAHHGGHAIVYAPTIARVGETVALLARAGIEAVPYHGQMEPGVRQRNQERWMADEVRVLVGTIAFGLGINKPSVRAVIHLSLPKSLEQYYQEAGRAGRDGLPSDCALLWRRRDAGLLAHFINGLENPAARSGAWERYRAIREFAEGDGCRHRRVCLHFGEEPRWETCGSCDACGAVPEWLAARETTVVPEPAPEREADPGLLEHLRSWRREVARASGVPAYVVFHDTTLRDLCLRRPADREALLEVTGIGERKAALYGEAILEALKAFAEPAGGTGGAP